VGMSPDELTALMYKYPSCGSCTHRGERTYKQTKKKNVTITWCDFHNRAVTYDEYRDEKGRLWVHGSHTCDEFHYEYVFRPLFPMSATQSST
jgi:hypothetical protein